MYLQVIETCITILEMMTRDHFVLDDDYDDDMTLVENGAFVPVGKAL